MLAAGLSLVLSRTGFGLKVQMFGANPLAARYAAIDIERLLLKVYVASGMLAAVAGLVIMSRANSAKADYGQSYTLLAVLIAVLGGVNPYGGYGRVIGVVLAVLTMQFLSSGLNMLQVSNFARELIWGALLILVMIINTRPWRRRRVRGAPRPAAGRPSMKKILNAPADYVDEMLDGLVAAHPEYYRLHGDSHRVIARAMPGRAGKVGHRLGRRARATCRSSRAMSGRGSSTPAPSATSSRSPSAEQMADAIRAADGGAGVLRLYGNYGGDVMNFDMAGDLVEFEDIRCTTVLLADDVASAPPEEREKRRGVAGMVYAFKIAGAAAEAGHDLDEVTRRGAEGGGRLSARSARRSPPARCPRRAGPPSRSPRTRWRWAWASTASPASGATSSARPTPSPSEMMDRLLADMAVGQGDRVSILVNSLGATPPEELYILYRTVKARLEGAGASIVMPLVGRYATSMEMAGVSFTLLKLDEELEGLADGALRLRVLEGRMIDRAPCWPPSRG